MSFGMWILAFYCSPGYFMARGKWRACVLNSVFYGLAVVLLISLFGAISVPFFPPVFAPLFWLLGVAHAGWDMRSVMMKASPVLEK